MRTGAVITAAGLSSRMGEFKPLLDMGGISAVKKIIGTLQDGGADEIVVVTGHRAAELEEHLKGENVHFVKNERYAETQMLDSVKLGLQYMAARCDKVLFTPVDVPAFSADTVRAVLSSSAGIAIPICGGKDGHPVKISSSMVQKILRFTGEGGLHGALEYCGCIERVEVADNGAVCDMDTPEDYVRLLGYEQ